MRRRSGRHTDDRLAVFHAVPNQFELILAAKEATVCRRLGIEVFFEDMPEVVNKLDPDVLALVPFDADLGRLTYIDN